MSRSRRPSFWRAVFRLQYQILAFLDPLIRSTWRRGGIGNVLELRVAKRNGTGSRSRLVGLLRANGQLYLGHPSGHVGWTRDLEAAGTARLIWPNTDELELRATRLAATDGQREQAILATGQHPFPGNLVYR